jgi:serine/threonine-protein kinase
MRLGDRYQLLELIGEGGMGGVFRAQQLDSGRIVALKLLHPELAQNEYIARRFEREANAASRLSHPNIVEVIDFGAMRGHSFLAMELLTGRSLADLIALGDPAARAPGLWARARRLLGSAVGATPRGRVSIEHTLAIMRQVLDGLGHAHGRGVVHRDLKPDNIMLLPSPNGREQVKLLDFGIAKVGDDLKPGAKPLTQAGVPLGTPHYMPPEQAAGETTDARSDLYACGVILYEMLTGHCPFDGNSTVDILSKQLTAVPEPLRARAPEAAIPEALERVVLRALAKRPKDRYASAAELRRALDAAVGVADARAPARRRRTAAAALAVSVAALGVFAARAVVEHHAASRTSASPPPRESACSAPARTAAATTTPQQHAPAPARGAVGKTKTPAARARVKPPGAGAR